MKTNMNLCVAALTITFFSYALLYEQSSYTAARPYSEKTTYDLAPSWDETLTRACPCPTAGQLAPGPKFVVCNLQGNSIDTNQLVVHGSACFQGPVQFCSSVEGPPIPPLECLYFIGEAGQVPPEGFSNLEMMRTRAFDCSGTAVNILFNTTTKDPADAFTLLKTIRACDLLRFTQIGPNDPCPVIRTVETQAVTGVTGGCGDVLTLSVFDASGLFDIYSATGDCVSLLNFGQPSTASETGSASGALCLCWTLLPACTAVTQCTPCSTSPLLIPAQCDSGFVDGSLMFTFGGDVFISSLTKDNTDATDKLSSIQIGDLIRLSVPSCSAAFRDIRVRGINTISGANTDGFAICASIEKVVGALTGCLCLECFGPVATLQDCWDFALCVNLNLSDIPPIPTACNAFKLPGAALIDNILYPDIETVAFNFTDLSCLDTSPIFEALRVGDCIQLYDPTEPTAGFGLYHVTGITQDGNFVVLGIENLTGSPGVIIPAILCLKTYGPCCQ